MNFKTKRQSWSNTNGQEFGYAKADVDKAKKLNVSYSLSIINGTLVSCYLLYGKKESVIESVTTALGIPSCD